MAGAQLKYLSVFVYRYITHHGRERSGTACKKLNKLKL